MLILVKGLGLVILLNLSEAVTTFLRAMQGPLGIHRNPVGLPRGVGRPTVTLDRSLQPLCPARPKRHHICEDILSVT